MEDAIAAVGRDNSDLADETDWEALYSRED